MEHPHVAHLSYSVASERRNQRVADKAPPIEGRIGAFRYRLHESRLELWPEEHFPSEEAARAYIEPLLRGWELHVELTEGWRLRFRPLGASIVDLAPESGGAGTVSDSLEVLWSVEAATATRSDYPPPPSENVRESDNLHALRMRWRAAVDEHEPVLATSYWILTNIISTYGNGDRKAAARRLRVTKRVLEKLGELSERQHAVHGRKVKSAATPLSDDELGWIMSTVPFLIYRAAQVEAGVAALPQLGMNDY